MNMKTMSSRWRRERAARRTVRTGVVKPWLPLYITTNLPSRPWALRNGFFSCGTESRWASCGHGGITCILALASTLRLSRSAMKRSSATTSTARRRITRLNHVKIRATSDFSLMIPSWIAWSGFRSMTQNLIGTRRIAPASTAANEHIGGEVLTTMHSSFRAVTACQKHCVMNKNIATARTGRLFLPKDERGTRTTSTPSRISRAGKALDGSSYPRREVTTRTRRPRRASSAAASCMCWPTLAASGG